MRAVKRIAILIAVLVVVSLVIDNPGKVAAALIAALVILLILKFRKPVKMQDNAVKNKIAGQYGIPFRELSDSIDFISVVYESEYAYKMELEEECEAGTGEKPVIRHSSFHHQYYDKERKAIIYQFCSDNVLNMRNGTAATYLYSYGRVWASSAGISDNDPNDETKLIFSRQDGSFFAYRLYPSGMNRQVITRIENYNLGFICLDISYGRRFIDYYDEHESDGTVEMPWSELQQGDITVKAAAVADRYSKGIIAFETEPEDSIEMLYLAKECAGSREKLAFIKEVPADKTGTADDGRAQKVVVSPDFEREVFVITVKEEA